MKTLSITPLLLCSAMSFSNEQTDTLNWKDAFSNKRESGGYLSAGLILEHYQGLYKPKGFESKLNLRGAYYFKNGLFAEFPGFSDKFESNLALGYNLANSIDWEFDAVFSYAHGELSYDYKEDSFNKNSTPYIGLRAMGTIAGLDAMLLYGMTTNKRDFSGGHYAAVWLAKSWNIQNWHFFTSVGLQYQNQEILDYYYGVPETANYHSEYHAKDGLDLIYKLGVKKPISENWLVEGFYSYTDYADSIINSPYSQNILKNEDGRKDKGSRISLSLYYVF